MPAYKNGWPSSNNNIKSNKIMWLGSTGLLLEAIACSSDNFEANNIRFTCCSILDMMLLQMQRECDHCETMADLWMRIGKLFYTFSFLFANITSAFWLQVGELATMTN